MSSVPKIMIVRETQQIHDAVRAMGENLRSSAYECLSCQDALQHLGEFNPQVVIIDSPMATPPGGAEAMVRLFDSIDAVGVACLILVDGSFQCHHQIPEWVQVTRGDISADELYGRLASIHHYQQIVRRAQTEMRHMQRLSQHINKQFAEVDQDMRLARRLQDEFLPRVIPQLDGVRFSVLYRPASWVSGDIYDISRMDEQHVSFYVADAVGHGMAASLLTVYIKRSLVNKEIGPAGYRLLKPSETLYRLNESLVSERLKNSQFVTVSYCVFNIRERTLQFARAGHPFPILVDPGGEMRELKSDGSILGLFEGQEFPDKIVQLVPGQKLILFSDGMELAFVENRDSQTGEPRYKREFQKIVSLSGQDLVHHLEQIMDTEEGSLNPRDDVTMLVVEITG